MGENRPFDQRPDSLPAGISKENREKLEKVHQRASGKVPLGVNERDMLNRRKWIHNVEPEDTEEAIEAADRLLSLQGNVVKGMLEFIDISEDHDHEKRVQVNFDNNIQADKGTSTSELEAARTLASFVTAGVNSFQRNLSHFFRKVGFGMKNLALTLLIRMALPSEIGEPFLTWGDTS